MNNAKMTKKYGLTARLWQDADLIDSNNESTHVLETNPLTSQHVKHPSEISLNPLDLASHGFPANSKDQPIPLPPEKTSQKAISSSSEPTPNSSAEPINRGLDNVIVADTKISHIDGTRGKLLYAGYPLEDLVALNCCYEDVVHLLLRGRLPSSEERLVFARDLANRRILSPEMKQLIDAIPHRIDYMDALRTAVSALGIEIDTSFPPNEEQALNCIAKMPVIVSRIYRSRMGQTILEPKSDYSHAENYLYMLYGNTLDMPCAAAYAKAFNNYLITTAEHGMNASTFTARVVCSTQSDLISSITAALSALKGPLHGGAPVEVMRMLDEIGSIENAEPWLRAKLEKHEVLMGMGHRVYKNYDPRAAILIDTLAELQEATAFFKKNNVNLKLILHVEKVAVRLLEEYKPGKKLHPNVEFGVAGLLRSIGMSEPLYVVTFALARCVGWSAHCIEQAKNNRLMRPSTHYSGPWPDDSLKNKQAYALNKYGLLSAAQPSMTPETAPSSGLGYN